MQEMIQKNLYGASSAPPSHGNRQTRSLESEDQRPSVTVQRHEGGEVWGQVQRHDVCVGDEFREGLRAMSAPEADTAVA